MLRMSSCFAWLILALLTALLTLTPAVADAARLQIAWNPGLEALALQALLARQDDEGLTTLQRQARADFAGFGRHPLISGSALSEANIRHVLTPERLAQATAFADFIQSTRLGDWLERHRADYELARRQLLGALPHQDLLAVQEAWHRRSFGNYAVFFSPLLPIGTHKGLTLLSADGQLLPIQVLGPVLDPDGKATFADGENLIYLMLREFGHAFCDPVVASFAAGPELALNQELLVRAVHARLVLQLYGPEAYERHLQREAAQGYGPIRRFAARLEDYERNPARYPSLTAFYPELVKALAEAGE